MVQVFEDFRYVDQVETDDTAVLVFEAGSASREVDGVDILRFDGDGRITEMMVMVRPMSGMHALAEAMQERLEAARSAAGEPSSRLRACTAGEPRSATVMEISKVGVVGCGLMGHGIAQICAQAGWDVVVREVDQESARQGHRRRSRSSSAEAVEKGKLEQADADARPRRGSRARSTTPTSPTAIS